MKITENKLNLINKLQIISNNRTSFPIQQPAKGVTITSKNDGNFFQTLEKIADSTNKQQERPQELPTGLNQAALMSAAKAQPQLVVQRYIALNNVLTKQQDLQAEPANTKLAEKASVINKPNKVHTAENATPVFNEWQTRVRDIVIKHLRSQVGQGVESGDLKDLDGNGVVSFNDISLVINQMNKGDFSHAVEIALKVTRANVGQQSSSENGIFDFNNDGVISFADLSYLRGVSQTI